MPDSGARRVALAPDLPSKTAYRGGLVGMEASGEDTYQLTSGYPAVRIFNKSWLAVGWRLDDSRLSTLRVILSLSVCSPLAPYRRRGARSRVGVGCLSIVLSVAVRAGQVSASAAHCRMSGTSQPDHGEQPPCRPTHTTGAAKSAARCLSSGAQPPHANCGVWRSNLSELDRQLDEIEQSER